MVPDMELAQRCWVAVSKGDPAAAAGIMETIRERNMAPWYAHLCQHHPGLFPMDEALLAKMKEANEAEAKRIQEVKKRSERQAKATVQDGQQYSCPSLWSSSFLPVVCD